MKYAVVRCEPGNEWDTAYDEFGSAAAEFTAAVKKYGRHLVVDSEDWYVWLVSAPKFDGDGLVVDWSRRLDGRRWYGMGPDFRDDELAAWGCERCLPQDTGERMQAWIFREEE